MSQDPEEAGVDWNGTGYGTGDPNANGFLDKFSKWMPYIVAGIFTAGALQSMGIIPGATPAEASAVDTAVASGTLPASVEAPAGLAAGGVPSTVAAATSGAGIPAAVGGAASAGAGAAGAGGASAAGGAGASAPSWSSLIKQIPTVAGNALSSASQAAATNRGAQAGALLKTNEQNNAAENSYQNQLNQRTLVNDQAQSNAWKKLMASSYALNYTPPASSPNQPYVRAMPGVSADAQAGAKSLVDTTRDALMSGQYTNNGGAPLPAPVDRSNYALPNNVLNPSGGEQALNYLGTGLSGWGGLINLAKKRSGVQ